MTEQEHRKGLVKNFHCDFVCKNIPGGLPPACAKYYSKYCHYFALELITSKCQCKKVNTRPSLFSPCCKGYNKILRFQCSEKLNIPPQISDEFGAISCFQYFLEASLTNHTGGKTIIGLLEFQNSSTQAYQYMKDYQEREWNHVCWRASGGGRNDYIVNGEIRNTFQNKLVVLPSDDKTQSAFILGQEPDTLRGSFNPKQAFRGKIANLNLWNRILSDQEIIDLATCKSNLQGNVIKWDKTEWSFMNTTTTKIENEDLCIQSEEEKFKEKVFIFPFLLPFDDASDLCAVHGGTLFVPKSDIENNLLRELVKPNLARCDSDKQGQVGSWLGIHQSDDGTMMRENLNGSLTKLNYSKWDAPPRTTHTCGVFFENGFWDSRNRPICNEMKACPVCEFSSIPKLSIKGVCFRSYLDWYWYLDKSEDHKIFYNGYKNEKLYPNEDFSEWKYTSQDEDFFYHMKLEDGAGSPVGLHQWQGLTQNLRYVLGFFSENVNIANIVKYILL